MISFQLVLGKIEILTVIVIKNRQENNMRIQTQILWLWDNSLGKNLQLMHIQYSSMMTETLISRILLLNTM